MKTINTKALTKARAYIQQNNIKADIYIKTASGLTLLYGLGNAEHYLIIDDEQVQISKPL